MSIFNATAPSGGGEVKTATANLSTASTGLNFNGNIGQLITSEPSWWVLVNKSQTGQSSKTICYASSNGDASTVTTNYKITDYSEYGLEVVTSSGYLSLRRVNSSQGSFYGNYILYYMD